MLTNTMRLHHAILFLTALNLQFFPAAAFSADSAWKSVPLIRVAADADDRRIELVTEALGFWNKTLAELGTSFRFGDMELIAFPPISDQLKSMSAANAGGEGPALYPAFMDEIDGNILVLLTGDSIVSFTEHWPAQGKAMIAVRSDRYPPLSLQNIARNVIAHELGHAIGLGHNTDPALLMCGRPATCRPDAFASSTPHFLRLSASEKTQLVRMYLDFDERRR